MIKECFRYRADLVIPACASLGMQHECGPWMWCCTLGVAVFQYCQTFPAQPQRQQSVCWSPLWFWVHLGLLGWFRESTAAFASGAALGKAGVFLCFSPASECSLGTPSECSSRGSRFFGYCHWISDSSRGLNIAIYIFLTHLFPLPFPLCLPSFLLPLFHLFLVTHTLT